MDHASDCRFPYIQSIHTLGIIRTCLFVLAYIMIASCASIDVRIEYDTGFDFDSMKNYKWNLDDQKLPIEVRLRGAITGAEIRAYIDKQLSVKGLVATDGDDHDFQVGLQTARNDEMAIQITGTAPDDPREPYTAPGTGGHTQVYEYEEYSLSLDMTAADGGGLLWRGVGTTKMSSSVGAQEKKRRILEAVARMLDGFPPASAAKR